MIDLSILIPARNEIFLSRTIEDLLKNMRGNTEIIAICDGNWPDPPVCDHKQVTLIRHSKSIGQRACVNDAARFSTAKYLMKLDAHCTVDEGFDVKMLEDMQDNWTMVPTMKNLHAFDWICQKCGYRWDQGPDPIECAECDNTTEFEKDITWEPRRSPRSTSYCFNRELQFGYFGQYKRKQKGDLVETMSLQGSCFMATQDKYWELELCDESWGSWGQQGTEVALKTWLSGGRVICTRKTWYAHLFRTRPGFSWPYPNPGKSQERARKISRDLFLNDKWPKATRKLSWLIEKFAPVPGWEDYPEQKQSVQVKGLTKGIVYYTNNQLNDDIFFATQKQLAKASDGHIITSVSLKKLHRFGRNIVLDLEPGYLTMFKQILAGLEKNQADIIFFCEHDVLYHPSHFDFVPPAEDTFFYNTNVWKVRFEDGHAMRTDFCQQTSGLCAYRKLLLEHYRKRVAIVEKNGYSTKIGFEPGTHGRPERIDDHKSDRWESKFPNIDIRHSSNLSPTRWDPDEYRNKRYIKGWIESDKVPGWGVTKGRMDEILSEI